MEYKIKEHILQARKIIANYTTQVNFLGPAEGETSGINTIDKRIKEKREGRW